MRVRTVAAGLVVAVSLSSGCGFKAKEPKAEPPSTGQKSLEKALLGAENQDTAAKDIFGVAAIPKK